jgi:phage shock protein A
MNPFKRIVITLNANLGQFLDQIENHEALAESGIREVEKAAAHARHQFRRIQNDQVRITKRLEELEKEQNLWADRARRLHASDEASALECVKRIKVIERETARLQEQKKQQGQIEFQLAEDLRVIEEKLNQLRIKRSALATRQAQADAAEAIEKVEASATGSLDTLFDRWEASIESQYPFQTNGSSYYAKDDLEVRLVRGEEQEELKKALDELVKR